VGEEDQPEESVDDTRKRIGGPVLALENARYRHEQDDDNQDHAYQPDYGRMDGAADLGAQE
jgi:hypothetical protein